jgi:hypothetical protein
MSVATFVANQVASGAMRDDDRRKRTKDRTITVVMDTWTERERGWGQRPDGGSLHLSRDGYDAFVKDFWDREKERNPSGAVPEEYSREDGNPRPFDVPEEVGQHLKSPGRYLTNAQVKAVREGKNPFRGRGTDHVQC